jgi:PhzF family phenazine biosynthesis protein
MQLAMKIIDAFTDTTFKGNSAAVIITDNWLSDALMQSIAIENNLSETAFVKKNDDGSFDIRWFSPITEIAFCGHATLAASFVIFSENNQLNTIDFHAAAVGKLTITNQEDGTIEMNFPNTCPSEVIDIPDALLQGLSLKPTKVLRNQQAYFAVYDDENDIHAITQQSTLIKALAPYDVVITAPASKSSQYDFVSRYFWPASGGDEDPVTGSIHTGLAPYWAERFNKNVLTAFQASRRGGVLQCNVDNDRVYISGKAVQYLEGSITV